MTVGPSLVSELSDYFRYTIGDFLSGDYLQCNKSVNILKLHVNVWFFMFYEFKFQEEVRKVVQTEQIIVDMWETTRVKIRTTKNTALRGVSKHG